MNKRGDEPRTLLRRLLDKADERATEAETEPRRLSQLARETTPRPKETSPVRPPHREVIPPPPMPPQPHSVSPEEPPLASPLELPFAGVEERLQAEEALEQLRKKTSQIANEFAEGKLNRAQFTAMYSSYNERRVIIERLLARDPNTQAWQSVARPGHTSFLRQHFEARVVAYMIYNHGADDANCPLTYQGSAPIPVNTIQPILTALRVLLRTHTGERVLSPLRRPIDNGRWISVVPGRYTTTIVVFSLEPSMQQYTHTQDLQRDFERANRFTLERGIRAPEQLVFPHRALFDKPGE